MLLYETSRRLQNSIILFRVKMFFLRCRAPTEWKPNHGLVGRDYTKTNFCTYNIYSFFLISLKIPLTTKPMMKIHLWSMFVYKCSTKSIYNNPQTNTSNLIWTLAWNGFYLFLWKIVKNGRNPTPPAHSIKIRKRDQFNPIFDHGPYQSFTYTHACVCLMPNFLWRW